MPRVECSSWLRAARRTALPGRLSGGGRYVSRLDSADASDLDEVEVEAPVREEVGRSSLLRVLRSHPRDAIACCFGLAAVTMIIINSLYLQPSPHPAPMFTIKPRPVGAVHATGTVRPRAAATDAARTSSATRAQPEIIAAAPGRDAIGALITTSSKRVLAVQRALADFGYGPVKPTGIFGPDTRAAIEKFERDRKLPVTGQLSERVIRELSAVTSRPLD